MNARKLISVAAAVEGATGLGLLFLPRQFIQLLLAADLAKPGVAVCGVCGFALLALGLACWPGKQMPDDKSEKYAARALLFYNASATAYLAYLRAIEGYRGIALLPAILFHAAMTSLLILHSRGIAPASS